MDWTKVWKSKYKILGEYENIIDTKVYSKKIQEIIFELKEKYGLNDQDAMLVLKDIMYKIYLNSDYNKNIKR